MPRVIILLIVVLFPCIAEAQISYLPLVQSISTAANVSSNTCVFPRNATTGNYVIVSIYWFSSTNTPTVSDSQTNTYTQKFINTSPSVKGAVYTTTATANNQITVTVSISGGSFLNLTCSEFTPDFSLTIDVQSDNTFSGSPSTATSPSVTTTLNNDLIYCSVGGFDSAGLFFSVAPFTMSVLSNGADSSGSEFWMAGQSGSTSCTFNVRGTSQGTLSIIAFKSNSIAIQSPATLPDAALSTAYQYTLLSTGGAGPLTWSITSGSLPSGLSLNASTGVITGTPSVSNNFNITFQVTDGTHTITKATTLKVTTAFNTPTIVQSKGLSANSSALTFTSNVTAGNTIIVAGDSGTNVTNLHAEGEYCTDTVGTNLQLLSKLDFQSVISNQSRTIAFYGGVAPSSGADIVQCGFNGVTGIWELSNVQFFGNENVGAGLRGTSASPITSSSLTTIVPNELLFSTGATYTTSASNAIQSPFTAPPGNSGWFSSTGSNAATTVTGYTSSFAFTGNGDTGWGISGILGIRPGSNGIIAPPSATNQTTIL